LSTSSWRRESEQSWEGSVPARELAPKSREERAVKLVRKGGIDAESRLSFKLRFCREAGGSVSRLSKIVLVNKFPCSSRVVRLDHWLRSSGKEEREFDVSWRFSNLLS
jgi:hypothetical protein